MSNNYLKKYLKYKLKYLKLKKQIGGANYKPGQLVIFTNSDKIKSLCIVISEGPLPDNILKLRYMKPPHDYVKLIYRTDIREISKVEKDILNYPDIDILLYTYFINDKKDTTPDKLIELLIEYNKNDTKNSYQKIGILERLEAARVEAARVEAARVKAARVEAARVEADKLKAARVEAARVEAARVEADKLKAARVEAPTYKLGDLVKYKDKIHIILEVKEGNKYKIKEYYGLNINDNISGDLLEFTIE